MYQSDAPAQTANVSERVAVLVLGRRIAVLVCPLAFAFGAAYWLTADAVPGWPMLSVVAVVCLWMRLRVSNPVVQLLSVALICGIAGAVMSAIRSHAVATPRLDGTTPITSLSGRVTAIEPGRTALRLLIVPHSVDGVPASSLPRRIRLTHRSALEVRPGQDVQCRVRLYPPPQPVVPGEYDFGRQAYFLGVGAVGYALGACRTTQVQSPRSLVTNLSVWRDTMRRDVAEYVYTHTPGARGMAAAMISGDRSFMPLSDVEALRVSGLGHLLAISGLHMGLVIGLVFLAVRRLWPLVEPLAQTVPVPKAAAVIALAAATCYLILSGGSVSTQRAWIMGAVAMGAILADRSALSLVSVAVAMWIVMLLRPESVLTPGFQMSFAATAALIALYENWPRRQRGTQRKMVMWSLSLLACSTVTFLATMPFALYHFGRAAPLSIPANLLAMPVISLVTAPSAVLAGCAGVLSLAHWPLAVTGASLGMVLDIAHWIASHDPGVLLAPMPDLTVLLCIAAMSLAVLTRGHWRLAGLGPLLAGAVIWSIWPQPVAHLSLSGNVYIRSDQQAWFLWRPDGHSEKGLRPLSIRGTVMPLDCRDSVCEQQTPRGSITVGSDGVIGFRRANASADIRIDLAEAQSRGGASILSGIIGDQIRFRSAEKGALRPWQSTSHRRRGD